MLIAQISDTHIGGDMDKNMPDGPDRIEMMKAFVSHIKGLDKKPDVILHNGDVVQGGAPELYETVRSVFDDIGVPVYFSVGNRDKRENLVTGLGTLGGAELVDGFLIYSIDDYPVRLIAMDTQHRELNIGTTCSVRLGALEKLLKQQPDKPTALFMHHPPFEVTTSKYPFQFDDPVLADAFLKLVSENKQIVHLFCGHMHREFGVELDTCFASCVPSLTPDNRLGDFEDNMKFAPLYQLHRWNADAGRFETSLHNAKV
ncbi:MAG: metallophosphoesterase [Magnetovibrio sp.]|nr:metallophosphoesterase [Magnetovibrio sp.]